MQVVDRKCLTTLLLHTRDLTLETRWNLGLGRGSPQLSPRYLASGKLSWQTSARHRYGSKFQRIDNPVWEEPRELRARAFCGKHPPRAIRVTSYISLFRVGRSEAKESTPFFSPNSGLV